MNTEPEPPDNAAGETPASRLVLMVYDELRRLAAARLRGEKEGHTLQPTALVHEAWLKLADTDSIREFRGRTHFLGVAAEAMRCILIDRARRKAARRHGGGLVRAEWPAAEAAIAAPVESDAELIAIHEAVEQLAAMDARKAELVKLRYFVGLTLEESADALGISLATAKRDWTFSRAWLARSIQSARKQR